MYLGQAVIAPQRQGASDHLVPSDSARVGAGLPLIFTPTVGIRPTARAMTHAVVVGSSALLVIWLGVPFSVGNVARNRAGSDANNAALHPFRACHPYSPIGFTKVRMSLVVTGFSPFLLATR